MFMSVTVSILVLIAIFIGAACQIKRLFQVSQHRGCPGCDHCVTRSRLQSLQKAPNHR